MSRLTEKNKYDTHYSFSITKNLLQDAYDKLGKLEDLEEKYDLPLDVLVTLLDHYQYYDEDGHQRIIHSLDMYHKQIMIKKYENDDDIYGYYEHLNFKDYKKTWWLKEDKSE